ncbi:hypothetical protein BH23CHL8_BH23CHL8_05370 [soil metagenome]
MATQKEDGEPVRIDIESRPLRKGRRATDDATRAAEGMSATLVEKLAERIGAHAGVSAVFGEPIVRDGRTVIPVARSLWGAGAGSGGSEDDGSGSGGGGGAMAQPVGYIEVADATSTYVPLTRPWQDARLILAWAVAIWLVSRAVNRIMRG